MAKLLLYFTFLMFVLAVHKPGYAQQPKKTDAVYNFAPGQFVIFRDDFNDDSAGAFPPRWHIANCDASIGAGSDHRPCWKIQKDGADHELVTYNSFNFIKYITPNIGVKQYLHNDFILEFDITYSRPECMTTLAFYPREEDDSCPRINIHLFGTGKIEKNGYPEWSANIPLGAYPTEFNCTLWHHVAIAYKNKVLDIYIDRCHITSLADCKFSPYAFSLGCIGQIRYKHFKITSSENNNIFTKILTENKFVTHAINFDIDKSTILPVSMGFIAQLANFLKNNPDVKLEIDGHTDSDGNVTSNITLSQARADEVKKQLTIMGIDNNRLTTKGFGASRPLLPNTTPEGKANNRRVEFIKM